MADANNGHANGTTTPEAPVNRIRGRKGTTPATKFGRLYALVGKTDKRTCTLKRVTEEGACVLRVAAYPLSLTVEGVVAVAEQHGARVTATAAIGDAAAGVSGVALDDVAAELVREMCE